MKAMLQFLQSLNGMALGWRLWIGVLMIANGLGPLLSFRSIEGRVTLMVFLLSAIIMSQLHQRIGFVRLLGVGHFPWFLLIPWLYVRHGVAEPGSPVAAWILSVIVLNSVSLTIDVVDVSRYVLGDREPQVHG